jgi:hypothetical protein
MKQECQLVNHDVRCRHMNEWILLKAQQQFGSSLASHKTQSLQHYAPFKFITFTNKNSSVSIFMDYELYDQGSIPVRGVVSSPQHHRGIQPASNQ